MINNLPTRKIIALAFTLAIVIASLYCTVTGKQMDTTLITLGGGAIAYYFGKSTALEMPKVANTTSNAISTLLPQLLNSEDNTQADPIISSNSAPPADAADATETTITNDTPAKTIIKDGDI